MKNVDNFLERVQQRDLPTNPMARLELLARETAEGAIGNLWPITFVTQQNIALTEIIAQNKQALENYIIKKHHKYWLKESPDELRLRIENIMRHEHFTPTPEECIPFVRYLFIRWGFAYPALELLEVNGYISLANNKLGILKTAFDVLTTIDPATIFISYKRSESSAFALLIAHILKFSGLQPFVDMQLRPGDHWRNILREQIENSDYFILLIGQNTLSSAITLDEVQIALEAGINIVPIWHNGFTFRADDWLNLPEQITSLVGNTHTIRVIEENPLAYDTAVRELLNRLGVSA